jgi:hypothetical protein
MSTGENGFGVEIRENERGWQVTIVDPAGAVVSERSCRDHSEARILASTVRQHIYWLSADRFRSYYGVEGQTVEQTVVVP